MVNVPLRGSGGNRMGSSDHWICVFNEYDNSLTCSHIRMVLIQAYSDSIIWRSPKDLKLYLCTNDRYANILKTEWCSLIRGKEREIKVIIKESLGPCLQTFTLWIHRLTIRQLNDYHQHRFIFIYNSSLHWYGCWPTSTGWDQYEVLPNNLSHTQKPYQFTRLPKHPQQGTGRPFVRPWHSLNRSFTPPRYVWRMLCDVLIKQHMHVIVVWADGEFTISFI